MQVSQNTWCLCRQCFSNWSKPLFQRTFAKTSTLTIMSKYRKYVWGICFSIYSTTNVVPEHYYVWKPQSLLQAQYLSACLSEALLQQSLHCTEITFTSRQLLREVLQKSLLWQRNENISYLFLSVLVTWKSFQRDSKKGNCPNWLFKILSKEEYVWNTLYTHLEDKGIYSDTDVQLMGDLALVSYSLQKNAVIKHTHRKERVTDWANELPWVKQGHELTQYSAVHICTLPHCQCNDRGLSYKGPTCWTQHMGTVNKR